VAKIDAYVVRAKVAKQWEVLKWLVQNRVAGDVTGGISEDLSRIRRLHRAETIETIETNEV
jgi:hypothetical protein